MAKMRQYANAKEKQDAIDTIYSKENDHSRGGKGKLGAYAMERVAAGAHLPTPWLFEPAKRPDDRADYWLECRGGNRTNPLYSVIITVGEYARKVSL